MKQNKTILTKQMFGVRNPPLDSENESFLEIEIDGADTANDATPYFGVADKWSGGIGGDGTTPCCDSLS